VTILITGATGLIGREFLETVSPDEDAVALAREESTIPGAASRGAVQWLAVDLRDPGFARELPGRADAIVHLAQARAYRDFPEQAVDIFDVNLGATARLLDYARRAGVERFVFASTATMYEPSHTPLTERSPIQCTSYYSASKRAAELLIGQYRELFACRLIRIFTVYGVGQRDQLIANLVRRVAGGEPVTVQGRSGLPVSPIHAADVARVLLRGQRGRLRAVGHPRSGRGDRPGARRGAAVRVHRSRRSPWLHRGPHGTRPEISGCRIDVVRRRNPAGAGGWRRRDGDKVR
jgi:nucleoside-diphosphate-sugar epimerase